MIVKMKKFIVLFSVSILFMTLIVLLFCTIIFSKLAYGARVIPASERAALIALYNATNGDNWNNNSGWKDEPLETDGFGSIGSEGTWYGIDVENGHVGAIILVYNNLTGYIPPEIGSFSELQVIQMGHNRLTGSIPPEIGKLSKLLDFFLQSNELEGSIPPEIGKLTNLIRLYLCNNRLSGNLPLEIGNLTRLGTFSVAANKLTGPLPSSIVNLRNWGFYGWTGQIWGNIKYNGFYANNEIVRVFLEDNDRQWEFYQTIPPTNVSVVETSSSSINVSWTPIKYNLDSGGYMVYYSTSPGGPRTYAGITPDKNTESFEVTELKPGIYYFVVKTRTDSHGFNMNTIISDESKEVCCALGTSGPFGNFDTPLDGSTVRSSIPVTGWALDDIGVDRVEIFHEAYGTLVYTGDAVFVEGARPDIQQAYPDYPNNSKAGWGYMMLTNLLPNSGNGTFKIHAIATDIEGYQVTLGTKTITCDNAYSVKPFGAIDTPRQGETISGNDFINFGWVLTPAPNTIPTNGSTITVWVDGVSLGHPVYNQYRADIARLFPGYNNSNGAVGYFNLDTTAYEDGVHTIQWTATDDAGNTDGIGSRYFTIRNGTTEGKTEKFRVELSQIPVDCIRPVRVKKGYNKKPQMIYPDGGGDIIIEIKESERVEIHLSGPGEPMLSEPLEHNNRTLNITSPPIGSFLDRKRGIFYWQPGPGFIGVYRLFFVWRWPDGERFGKRIIIAIKPKFPG
jgi:hypothetical protein